MRLTVSLLTLLAAALAIAFAPARFTAPARFLAPVPVTALTGQRVIRVEAGDSAFTPAVIRVNPGDRITIELVSRDVAHGLSIDGYPGVDLFAEPGQSARASFVADRAGTFKIRCSVACGNLHPFMVGKLAVGPNLLLLRAGALALLALAYGAWKAARAGKVIPHRESA